MKANILLYIFISANSICLAQNKLTGRITDSLTNEPLEGATIAIVGTSIQTKSDNQGQFVLTTSSDRLGISVSYVGYSQVSLVIDFPVLESIQIELTPVHEEMDEIFVSTGYQNIPINQMTGSYVTIDNDLLNRRVSPNIIDRLEDVTPGLAFNRNRGSNNSISIRGQSTIFSNADPSIQQIIIYRYI